MGCKRRQCDQYLINTKHFRRLTLDGGSALAESLVAAISALLRVLLNLPVFFLVAMLYS